MFRRWLSQTVRNKHRPCPRMDDRARPSGAGGHIKLSNLTYMARRQAGLYEARGKHAPFAVNSPGRDETHRSIGDMDGAGAVRSDKSRRGLAGGRKNKVSPCLHAFGGALGEGSRRLFSEINSRPTGHLNEVANFCLQAAGVGQ